MRFSRTKLIENSENPEIRKKNHHSLNRFTWIFSFRFLWSSSSSFLLSSSRLFFPSSYTTNYPNLTCEKSYKLGESDNRYFFRFQLWNEFHSTDTNLLGNLLYQAVPKKTKAKSNQHISHHTLSSSSYEWVASKEKTRREFKITASAAC